MYERVDSESRTCAGIFHKARAVHQVNSRREQNLRRLVEVNPSALLGRFPLAFLSMVIGVGAWLQWTDTVVVVVGDRCGMGDSRVRQQGPFALR